MPKVTGEYIDGRRKQILDAAFRCFARKGFHNATMRDIYAEAGLSSGAIYHYFKSKDEMIEASFALGYQNSLVASAQAGDDQDPMVAIERILDFLYEGLESAAAVGADRVNIQGLSEALINPRLLAPLREFFHVLQELLEKLIRRGQSDGIFNPDIDPKAAGEVILSSYVGLYVQKAVVPELEAGRHKEVVLALLRGSFANLT